MDKTANSQYDEEVNKTRELLHKMLNSKVGSDGKILLLLFVYQPLTTEEICTKVGFKSTSNFKYVLSVKLVEEGLIKELHDERWALWNYESFDSKQKYGASDIMHLIEVLENNKMSQEYRVSAGKKLVNYCSSVSEIVGGKDILRPFFNRNLDGFESINFESDRGIVFTHILISLNRYVAFQLQGEDDIQWMKDVGYPKLVSLFNKNGSIEGRNRILRILSQIYRADELDMEQRKLTSLLLMKFFDPKEDCSIAINCWDKLQDVRDDALKEPFKSVIHSLANSWETFQSWVELVNDESIMDESEQTEALPVKILFDDLKEILKKLEKITQPEKEILEKRGLEIMKRYYEF